MFGRKIVSLLMVSFVLIWVLNTIKVYIQRLITKLFSNETVSSVMSPKVLRLNAFIIDLNLETLFDVSIAHDASLILWRPDTINPQLHK